MKGRNLGSASLIFLLAMPSWCQETAPPAFEVASIRLNKTGVRGGSMDFGNGGDRLAMINMPLGALILVAYDITVRQLSGQEQFLSEKYDIRAKAARGIGRDEMRRMIQVLLTDRFHLRVHWEAKEVPIYSLVVTKDGPKLHKSSGGESGRVSPRIPSQAAGSEVSSGHLIFEHESTSDFAWALSKMAGIGDRVVIDNTGLNGFYDFELIFALDRAPAVVTDTSELPASSEAPSIFSALQQELGLKLESRRAAVRFLVIDHIQRPSEN
jgi:uncharacterized protein (TIGR03435 family)